MLLHLRMNVSIELFINTSYSSLANFYIYSKPLISTTPIVQYGKGFDKNPFQKHAMFKESRFRYVIQVHGFARF